jgi:hypothetical protein
MIVHAQSLAVLNLHSGIASYSQYLNLHVFKSSMELTRKRLQDL